jgi:hypothetical protein
LSRTVQWCRRRRRRSTVRQLHRSRFPPMRASAVKMTFMCIIL